jgi:putative DNA-invertase from lambdoid prophage Rac
MKCVIYARVSTEEQHTENQIRELKEFIGQRGWEIVEVYAENETAWKAGHQREWARLKQDALNRKFEIVVVWALDRVTRQGVGYLFQQIKALKDYNVKLVSMKEAWLETLTDLTEVFIALIAFIASYESKRRSERTKAGMDRARAGGKHIGRPVGSKDGKKRRRLGYLLREATAAEVEKYRGK